MSRSGAGVRIHSTTSRALVPLVLFFFFQFFIFHFLSFSFILFSSLPIPPPALLSFLHGCIRCPMGPAAAAAAAAAALCG